MSTEQSEEKRDNGYDWWGLNYEMGRMRIARSKADLRIWLSTTDICTALGQDIGLVYRVVSDEEQRTIGNGAQRVDCISELGLGAMLMYCPHPSDAASPAGRLREWIATKLADELRLRTPQQGNTAKPPVLLKSKKDFAAICNIPLPTLHAAVRAELVQVETGNQINILYPLNAEYLRVKQAEYEARVRAAAEAEKSEQGRAMRALAAKVTELEGRMGEASERGALQIEGPKVAEVEGMTSREIAGAVGKPERTARDWIKSMAAKSAAIAAKLAASTSTHPARYTLAESCLIIEEGLGKAAADAYRTNAVHAEMDKRATMPTAPHGLSAAMVANLLAVYGRTEAARRIDHLIGFPSAITPERKALPPISDIHKGQRLLNLKPPRSASSFLAEERWGKIGIYDLACKYGLPPATVEDVARKIGKRLTNIRMQDGVDIICGVFGIESPNWYMTSGEMLTRVIRGIDAAVGRAMNERADKIITEQSLF